MSDRDDLTLGVLVRLVDKLYERLDRELAELRVAVEELDYATVKRGAFEELHTRVDDLGAYTAQLDARIPGR